LEKLGIETTSSEMFGIWDRINLEMFEPSERHRDRQSSREDDRPRVGNLTHPNR
jgi:hypothetical protein